MLHQERGVTYLRVELVDLARHKLVGLLGVGVVDKVVFDLLGLGSHLVVSPARVARIVGNEVYEHRT